MLQNEVTLLRNEVAQLKQLLLAHKDCPVTLMQKKAALLGKYESQTSCFFIQHHLAPLPFVNLLIKTNICSFAV